MTNIKELQKKKLEKEKEEIEKSLNFAISLHREQKKSIQGIIDMPGYKTIKEFWILQLKQATEGLKNVRFTDLQEFGRVQSKANIAEKFILFLNELEK